MLLQDQTGLPVTEPEEKMALLTGELKMAELKPAGRIIREGLQETAALRSSRGARLQNARDAQKTVSFLNVLNAFRVLISHRELPLRKEFRPRQEPINQPELKGRSNQGLSRRDRKLPLSARKEACNLNDNSGLSLKRPKHPEDLKAVEIKVAEEKALPDHPEVAEAKIFLRSE